MKFWLLIIISFFATNLIKNAESVSQPKLNKTFDEIYGKGWDAEVPEFTETKEWHKMETQTTEVENKSTDQDNPNEQNFSNHFESFANRIIRERFDEIFGENWSEDENEFIEEDEADQNDCIDGQKCQKVQENGDPGTKLIKSRKNVYSDQQKREIVKEFIKMNNEYKQTGNYSQKEWLKIYAKISKSIGVSLRTIKKWKKEFGLTHKLQSDKEKMEKLKQYCEIKKGNPKIKDFEIAASLNIGESTLKQWKKELKNAVKDENDCSLQSELSQISQNKVYSDQQKRDIIQKFREMKYNYREKNKRAHSNKEWVQIEIKISNGLGVGRATIYKWIKELGLKKETKSKFSELEKREILKQFDEIKSKCKKAKLKNISMRELDDKIAKKLGVSAASIYNWTRFGLCVNTKQKEIKNL